MQKLKWATDGDEISGWHFNYTDTAFSALLTNQDEKLLCLVTPILDYQNGVIGYIEATMSMRNMFPGMYDNAENTWGYFVDEQGEVHTGSNVKETGKQVLDSILNEYDRNEKLKENATVQYLKLEGRELVISYMPCKKLNGNLILVQDITKDIKHVYEIRNIFILTMIFVLIGMGGTYKSRCKTYFATVLFNIKMYQACAGRKSR